MHSSLSWLVRRTRVSIDALPDESRTALENRALHMSTPAQGTVRKVGGVVV